MANEIDMMVAATRNKQPFTHFISIPVTMDHVKEAFLAPSDCGHHGLAGPEGEEPGQGAADELKGAVGIACGG